MRYLCPGSFYFGTELVTQDNLEMVNKTVKAMNVQRSLTRYFVTTQKYPGAKRIKLLFISIYLFNLFLCVCVCVCQEKEVFYNQY